MEIWMWISLYILQTLAGVVGYRKWQNKEGQVGETPQSALIFSGIVVVNLFSCGVLISQLISYGFSRLFKFIDFLAGVKNKTDE